MSDKELDNLFKEAAEGYNAPEDQSAWNDMSNRLDSDVTAPPFWNWKAVSVAALIGVAGLSVWLTSIGPEQITKPSTESTAEQNLEKEEAPLSATSDKTAEEKQSEDIQSAGIARDSFTKKTENTLSFPEKSELDSEGAKSRNGKSGNSIASTKNEASKNATSENVASAALLDKQDQTTRQESNTSVIGVTALAGKEQKSEPLGNSSSEAIIAPLKTDSLSTPSTLAVKKEDSVQTKEIEVKEKSDKGQSSISVKFSVSPDFSSIKMFTPDEPGLNYGLLVGYNFNSRWSIFTGAISSQKIYSSTEISKAYTSPKGYDYPVNKLDGECRVLDIPVNVYYTFLPGRSISFKAGLGISSYLMLSEDYTYHVDNPYGSDEYYQSVDNKNNEWFKVLNVSVTVQKKFGNRFSLELEPFLKSPLSGVGEGNVSLVSLGAFMNLRYEIFLFPR